MGSLRFLLWNQMVIGSVLVFFGAACPSLKSSFFLCSIGQSEKYHNIVQTPVWVGLHVNLIFALSVGFCMNCTCSVCIALANSAEKRLCLKHYPKWEIKEYHGIFLFYTGEIIFLKKTVSLLYSILVILGINCRKSYS